MYNFLIYYSINKQFPDRYRRLNERVGLVLLSRGNHGEEYLQLDMKNLPFQESYG